MDVVLQLQGETAGALHTGALNAPGVSDLNSVLAQFGLGLKPQHPGTPDPGLKSYFIVTDVPPVKAERIVAALLELEAVESAYIQPPVSPALSSY